MKSATTELTFTHACSLAEFQRLPDRILARLMREALDLAIKESDTFERSKVNIWGKGKKL